MDSQQMQTIRQYSYSELRLAYHIPTSHQPIHNFHNGTITPGNHNGITFRVYVAHKRSYLSLILALYNGSWRQKWVYTNTYLHNRHIISWKMKQRSSILLKLDLCIPDCKMILLIIIGILSTHPHILLAIGLRNTVTFLGLSRTEIPFSPYCYCEQRR